MRLERALRHGRHTPVASPVDADLLLVNTCGFIDAAKEESTEVIAELDRTRRPDQQLYVLGCLTPFVIPIERSSNNSNNLAGVTI